MLNSSAIMRFCLNFTCANQFHVKNTEKGPPSIGLLNEQKRIQVNRSLKENYIKGVWLGADMRRENEAYYNLLSEKQEISKCRHS